MRATLRDLLIAGVPLVQGRVFEPGGATAATPKPFLVVQEGRPQEGDSWGGLARPLEVWVFERPLTFRNVDAVEAQVRQALHERRFSEQGVEYLAFADGGASEDVQVADWDALARAQRFLVFALGWHHGLTSAPDPVVALRQWTAQVMPEVETDPETWTPSDAAPGVYWRLVALSPQAQVQGGAWIDAALRAHVVAPAHSTRLRYLRRLTEALALVGALDLDDGSPLLIRHVSADSETDPMRVGQLRLLGRYGVLETGDGGTPLRVAVVRGDVQGSVS
jgi:hypothetical protein